ncbi:hypothetical protein [Roseibium sp. RKSG952]|uniref:hypothetical protein n=1 Tax=Roseibium sp. RKSG952 TaxID=2529384 RepID=UPI0012BCFDBA|nr:hypothetical protein [Roseibium sp. RKSG952]MTI00657.1 hypothetical protein [Roseibium sp. RKSG952]
MRMAALSSGSCFGASKGPVSPALFQSGCTSDLNSKYIPLSMAPLDTHAGKQGHRNRQGIHKRAAEEKGTTPAAVVTAKATAFVKGMQNIVVFKKELFFLQSFSPPMEHPCAADAEYARDARHNEKARV